MTYASVSATRSPAISIHVRPRLSCPRACSAGAATTCSSPALIDRSPSAFAVCMPPAGVPPPRSDELSLGAGRRRSVGQSFGLYPRRGPTQDPLADRLGWLRHHLHNLHDPGGTISRRPGGRGRTGRRSTSRRVSARCLESRRKGVRSACARARPFTRQLSPSSGTTSVRTRGERSCQRRSSGGGSRTGTASARGATRGPSARAPTARWPAQLLSGAGPPHARTRRRRRRR